MGLQLRAGGRSRRLPVHLEQRQQLAPAVAVRLAVERGQQPLRAQRREEAEHGPQRGPAVGPLRVAAQALRVEPRVQLSRRLHVDVLHPPLRGEPFGELEHLRAAAEVAVVELLHRGLHQLAEAPAAGGRVGSSARPAAASLRARSACRPWTPRPPRAAHPSRPSCPPACGTAATTQGSIPSSRSGARCRSSSASSRASMAAAATICDISSPRCSGVVGAAACGCSRARNRLSRRRPAVISRDNAPGFGSATGCAGGLGRCSISTAAEECGTLPNASLARFWRSVSRSAFRGARQHGLGQLAHVRGEPLARHQVELAHQRDLLDAVEEKVRSGRVHLLQTGPGADLTRQHGRRRLEQQLHRVGDHERREAVGEVLVQLVHRFAQLGIDQALLRGARGRRRTRLLGAYVVGLLVVKASDARMGLFRIRSGQSGV